jgi:hypothetical protein
MLAGKAALGEEGKETCRMLSIGIAPLYPHCQPHLRTTACFFQRDFVFPHFYFLFSDGKVLPRHAKDHAIKLLFLRGLGRPNPLWRPFWAR